jgi:acyl-CoA thioesterase-2
LSAGLPTLTRLGPVAEGEAVTLPAEAAPPAAPPSGGRAPRTTSLAELLVLLELTALGDDAFEGGHPRSAVVNRHVFGGLVAAQALVAAGRSVEAPRTVHSLHCYFLRRGDPDAPVVHRVARSRDGGTFTHRQVRVEQHGRPIMEMACSFALPRPERPRLQHQAMAPATPGPDTQRPDHEVYAELVGPATIAREVDAFELRTVGLERRAASRTPAEARVRYWTRTTGPVPAEPALHAALLTYASDLRILHAALRPHGLAMYDGHVRPASVDHAVWFHQPARVDDWLLWDTESPWADHGRVLVRGRAFDTSGTLVAEVAQEGLISVAEDAETL